MNKSPEINELAAALSQAQAEMESVPFDATNPYYNSRYASLGAVINTAKNVLPRYGLAITQVPITTSYITDDDTMFVGIETVLMHKSGQFISDTISAPVYVADDAKTKTTRILQETGKIITYLRRYAYAAIIGLYADADNDGNDVPTPAKTPTKTPAQLPTMTLDEANKMTNSKGIAYGDMTEKDLAGYKIGLERSLNNGSLDEAKRETYLRKLSAVAVILKHRSTQPLSD